MQDRARRTNDEERSLRQETATTNPLPKRTLRVEPLPNSSFPHPYSPPANVTSRSDLVREHHVTILIRLLSEGAALGQTGFASGRLAQNGVARTAHDHSLSVRKDSRNRKTSGALHVHEVRVRAGHQTLELVLAGFTVIRGV